MPSRVNSVAKITISLKRGSWHDCRWKCHWKLRPPSNFVDLTMIHCSVSRISLLRRCDDWMDGKTCHWFLLPERNVFVLHFMGVFIYEAGGHSNPITDVSGHFEKKLTVGSWTRRWTTTTEATKHTATVHSSVFLHLMWCMISFINSTFISCVSTVNFFTILRHQDPVDLNTFSFGAHLHLVFAISLLVRDVGFSFFVGGWGAVWQSWC